MLLSRVFKETLDAGQTVDGEHMSCCGIQTCNHWYIQVQIWVKYAKGQEFSIDSILLNVYTVTVIASCTVGDMDSIYLS